MEFYIARQPILTIHRKVYAYELLYRGTQKKTLDNIDGEQATTSLLSSAFLTEGVETISGTRPCFINFTEDLLIKRIPLTFPKNQVIIEVLEDVNPTKEIIDACRFMVKEGYTIALDDFIYDKSLEPLIELASIIKIDFRLTPLDTIHKTLYKLKNHKVKLLAEKVETHEEFAKASRLGFSYFQGYFFNKPENIRIKELEANKLNMFRLLSEVSRKSTTLERLQKIISVDVSISYKLLRFLNSAYFYRLEKVKTVQHAVAYLGENELRRFVTLVLISELSSDKPDELIRLALIRAKFCELLGDETIFSYNKEELFLLGLFSFIDVMLENPMSKVMAKLPISTDVKEALNDEKGPLSPFLKIIQSYERQQLKKIEPLCYDLGVDDNLLPEIYKKALGYSNHLA